ncbi:MAG: hypothetical protein QOK10_3488 [Pseudonocardiales bacterium]|nr:hypothetical protein [Pseudonocardiales bacterium]
MTELANLQIDRRYNGPADSANGGVTCGLLARRLQSAAPVRVILRKPPPLDRLLRLEQDDRHLRAFDGTELVAEARRTDTGLTDTGLTNSELTNSELTNTEVANTGLTNSEVAGIQPVPPVDYPTAVAAAGRYDGLQSHPFPSCFVCGTERPDGLAVYAGAVDPGDASLVAAPLHVPSTSGLAGSVLVWAALDCPGGWSIGLVGRQAVLGSMTAQVFDSMLVDEHCVVVARCDGWDGRKAFARSSLYGADGRLIGAASHIWIELKAPSGEHGV